MPRTIIGGIRVNHRTYKAGDEDALVAVLDPSQVERLLDCGALAGDWGQVKVPAPDPDPSGEIGEDSSDEPDESDAFAVSSEGEGTDTLDGLDGVDVKVVEALRAGGFNTTELIRTATDKELEGLPHIGKATVNRLRELLG